ncbi:hypothetical protein G0Q06_12815 [Puniceicoccales bacterium CK1056]|uniref:Secreted protein n=1 Tax=Oceanipulchritudo coccoides TaxID=2706888 RepID=A0A6B2M6Q5_9BACT|nr:hypothetical protein [Oceanipulchritudo coccoides]NDV63340.1 hypothetical protein [Oceanipulchritudo coccoides]
MSRPIQITLITLACIGVYFGLRSLPVEKCEFLHYGDFINSEGVIEGCGYEETEFFTMSEIQFPILPVLTPLTDPVVGQPTTFKLTLFTTTGKPVKWEEIAVSHTEKIHAMVVDPSLQDYQHLHPQAAGPAGHYLFEMTPKRAGDYKVYLDFIPLINSRRTLLEASFTVPGTPETPSPGSLMEFEDGDLQFAFIPSQEKLVTGEEVRFKLEVETKDNSPTRFSPVMDSYAHVVAFDENNTGFAHLHPQNPFIEGQDPLNPELEFAFLFDQPGYYRVWAQVIVNDRQVFAPFDLTIR